MYVGGDRTCLSLRGILIFTLCLYVMCGGCFFLFACIVAMEDICFNVLPPARMDGSYDSPRPIS